MMALTNGPLPAAREAGGPGADDLSAPFSHAASFLLPAPAKINLALHVTGRRADGYHLLETLVVFARIGDELAFTPAEADRLAIDGPFADALDPAGDNLVTRARDLLRGTFREAPPVAIRLTKNLPVASGIGGGSSDAAATLRGLARLWSPSPDPAALARLGAALGADVPMCLAARPLIARGIGDEISVLDSWPPLHLVLVNPGVPVSTPAVFAALDSRDNAPLPAPPAGGDSEMVVAWLAGTRNDLEAPARGRAPLVDAVLAALRATGARFARMSGSGATCFGLYGRAAEAEAAAAVIAAREPSWFAVSTQTTGVNA